MLSTLAVCYLFLGGAGAGALLIAQVLDLVWVKTPLGSLQAYDVSGQTSAQRCLSFATLAGVAAALAGVACLLIDLGRVDRVLSLFVSPMPSIMAVGAYALAALLLVGVLLAVAHVAYVPWLSAGVVRAAQLASVVLAVVVMTYTGLLLADMPGVAFWRSPLVVVLFALSSLSCGIALVVLAAVLVERDAQVGWLLRRLMALDMALAALEALTALAFVSLALASKHPAVVASAYELVFGSLAQLWWVGFAACGLVVPIAAGACVFWRLHVPRDDARGERMHRGAGAPAFAFTSALARPGVLLCLSALVLTGGLCMRAGVADAGQHRALELQQPTVAEAAFSEVEEGETDLQI